MDDYLAKPVKGKILEKMLVKWALRGLRNTGRSQLPSLHADHDSNCAETERASPPLSSRPRLKHNNSSPSTARNLSFVVDTRLPGVETASDRAMKCVADEEKAIALRNDKLMIAADEMHMLQHHKVSPTAEAKTVRPEPPTSRLTMANVTKLDQEQNDRLLYTRTGKTHQHGDTSSSIVVEATDDSAASTADSMEMDFGSGKKILVRGKVFRNQSDRSQRTITPDGSGDSSLELD